MFTIALTSCSSKKEVLYFSDLEVNKQDKIVYAEGKIQVNDILSIVVSSNVPELAAEYNLNQSPTTPSLGYLVGLNGMITMPILGKIQVKDLTMIEIENLLTKKLIDENHLTNPIVTVRLLNAKFTILGEVNKPGTYNFTEQNISLLQALGYAGDLTIYGKRENVLIIREENNNKAYVTLDLTSKKWFDSPYYYVKPNDIIYVNPNDTKVKSAGYIGNFGTLMTTISVALSTIIAVLVLAK